MLDFDTGLFSKVTESTSLWRFNPVTGYWHPERACDRDSAQKWLEIYQKDEPEAVFKLSKRRPT